MRKLDMRTNLPHHYLHRGCFGRGPALWVRGLPAPERHVLLAVFRVDPERTAGVGGWGRSRGWAVDLECHGWELTAFSVASPHVERLFQRRADALRYARFLEWCVDGLTDEQLVECARVTYGRLL